MGIDAEVAELKARIESLEKECRHLERQCQMLIYHHEHVDNLVQTHELMLHKLQDDHK